MWARHTATWRLQYPGPRWGPRLYGDPGQARFLAFGVLVRQPAHGLTMMMAAGAKSNDGAGLLPHLERICRADSPARHCGSKRNLGDGARDDDDDNDDIV